MTRLKHHATFLFGCLVLSAIVYALGHLGGVNDPTLDRSTAIGTIALFWVAVLFIRLSHERTQP